MMHAKQDSHAEYKQELMQDQSHTLKRKLEIQRADLQP